MHYTGLFAAVLVLAHGAAGFATPSGIRTTTAGKRATQGTIGGGAESRHTTTSRPCRQAMGMSSTLPPQSERTPNASGGDFDSWFWGDAHVRGGVEHAVFQSADSAVVLFDGECNFCNSGVWMMISNSDAGNMRFCAQNSEMGLSLLHSFGQDQERLSSIAVLNKDGHLFTRSAALVAIMSRMHAPYPVLATVFNAVPESVRDEMYAWVSRRRHAFGTENLSCRIPEEDEVSRFLL